IRGYTESILEGRFGPLLEKQRNGLEVAARNILRLQNMIDELLEFERIQGGQLKVSKSDFDLPAVIRAVAATQEAEIAKRRISLQLDLPAEVGVTADRER